jgi:hypothetical protein
MNSKTSEVQKDLAIALLLAQHTVEQANLFQAQEVVIAKNDAPLKNKKGAASKSNDASQNDGIIQGKNNANAPPPQVVVLLKPGVYSATDFMRHYRHAKSRDERIQTISGFTGYTHQNDFGMQERHALSTAKQAIHGVVKSLTRHEQRVIDNSLAGYIAGLPDHDQKRVQDLLGRERETVELILSYQKEGSEALAQYQEQYLEQIRATLSLLGVQR